MEQFFIIHSLTVFTLIESLGLAAWYKMDIKFKPTPIKIPISIRRNRQAKKVPRPGIRSLSKYKQKK